MSGPRRLKASDVPSLLRPGMRVFVQGGAGEPLLIQAALREASEASAGVEYVAALTPGVNEFDYAALHPTTRMEGFFVAPPQRESFAAGKLRFLPINYCLIWEHLAASPPVDIAFLNLAPPDAQGRCSLGLSADFPSAVWPRAKMIVAQINPGLPSVADDPGVSWDRLDAVIEAEGPPIEQDLGAPDAMMQAIARHAASLIRDRDTLQIGIGKVQSAILAELKDRRDLGFQSGLISDAVLDLVEAGAVTGAAKTFEKGLLVGGLYVGTRRLYDWMRTAPEVALRAANHTHATPVIARLDNFVSINSAVEVDLLGQCNAEMVAGRQVSGTGGFADFVRGARLSRGGRSIVALPSRAGAKASRIVASLKEGTVVTGARSDVDYVVTEHGIADLRAKSVDERAEALIAIADPAFRDELTLQWRERRARM
jgi:4-hydroxybutyrate CoA-transferase